MAKVMLVVMVSAIAVAVTSAARDERCLDTWSRELRACDVECQDDGGYPMDACQEECEAEVQERMMVTNPECMD